MLSSGNDNVLYSSISSSSSSKPKERVGIGTESLIWHVVAVVFAGVVFCLCAWTLGYETAVDVPSLVYTLIALSSFLMIASIRLASLKITGGPRKPGNSAVPLYHHTQFDRSFVAIGLLTCATVWTTARLAFFYVNYKSYLHLTEAIVEVNPASNFNLILWTNLHAALDPFMLVFVMYPILFLWMLNDEANPRINEEK